MRGTGNVSPNPPVGAVIVGPGGRIIGEGYHHMRGEAHAEREALRDAHERGHAAELAGATMYVSLEPCDHHGRTPPCTEAVIEARIGHVVIGALDPNPRTAGGGMRRLQAAGIDVKIAHDAQAAEVIRRFATAVVERRPYVTLKLAASLDGRIAAQPGSQWLTGQTAREFVHDLRYAHDAVMVGAHTVAVDDPELTIRPMRARRRAFARVIVCGATPPLAHAKIFKPIYATRTLLLVPARYRACYEDLQSLATIVVVGDADAGYVALDRALAALYELEIAAILCEGGPTLAGALLAGGHVDRLEWLIAPRLLTTAQAPGVLAGEVAPHVPPLHFDRVERLGEDLRVTVDLTRP